MSAKDGALTHSFRALRKAKAASLPSAASSKETSPPVSASTRPVVAWSGCAFREGWLTFATLGWEARRDAVARAFPDWGPLRRGNVFRPRGVGQGLERPS